MSTKPRRAAPATPVEGGGSPGGPGLFDELKREQARRLRAEVEARHAREETARLLSSLSSIVIGLSREWAITQWNAAAEQAFGIPAKEIVGAGLERLESAVELPTVRQTLSRSGSRCEAGRIDEVRFHRPDGKEGFLGITINPILARDGEAEGFLLLCRDITERKSLESQLAHAQKLESIGQLAAGVAHEINTPIQYVGDNLRFLSDTFTEVKDLLLECRRLLDAAREGEVPRELAVRLRERLEEADIDYLAEEIPQAVDQTLEGVERVAKIVRSMKEFSHPGTGELTPTDVNKAILSTVTVSRNEWKYVAELETDLAEDLPQVHCIPGEFNQVLLNLIVNAAQAIEGLAGRDSEDRGTIVISTHRCDDEVEIRVRDSGTGIPVEARSKIFDPFFTTKEVGRGTGQGLAIAHAAITKKHGGSIRFETELGKGTTFIVRLPIERPPEA